MDTPRSSSSDRATSVMPACTGIRRISRQMALPCMVMMLCLFSARPLYAAGDISDPQTWYSMLNLPTYFINTSLLLTACGFVFVCFMLQGITRAILCICVCMAFIAYNDPTTITDPLHRYPFQMSTLQSSPNPEVRMWAGAHAVMIFFMLQLAIGINSSITNKKVEINV